MPEMPEVETVKETLKQLVLGKTIRKIKVFWPKIIKRPDDVELFKQRLEKQTIQDLKRRGKFILFILDEYTLVSHLRMEGKYNLAKSGEDMDKHTHVIFDFGDGTELRYRDVRKFGTMHVFKKGEEASYPPLLSLGPEPLTDELNEKYLKEKLNKTARPIKAVLLDQTVLVGLGNIYVDEALFKASIHPLSKANHLSDKSIKKLVMSIKETLSEAVTLGGSTIRSYLNSQGQMGMFQQKLNVYGREGEPCKTCGTELIKLRVAGRGTHICPTCQKE